MANGVKFEGKKNAQNRRVPLPSMALPASEDPRDLYLSKGVDNG